MKETIAEKYGMGYRVGADGMQYPNVSSQPPAEAEMGQYGRRTYRWMQEQYPQRIRELWESGQLLQVMQEVNEEAHQKIDQLVKQMMLKLNPAAQSQETFEIYQQKRMLRATAEEIVLKEWVYQMH